MFQKFMFLYLFLGIINWILSIPPFQILGRLAYCMFLVHLTFQFMRTGAMKVPKDFNDLNMVRFIFEFLKLLLLKY